MCKLQVGRAKNSTLATQIIPRGVIESWVFDLGSAFLEETGGR